LLERRNKSSLLDAAKDLLELPVLTAYNSDTTSRKMKTQHLYSDFINRSRAKEMELQTADHGTGEMKARFLSNNGSLAGALLFIIPKDKHSTMSSTQFQTALKLRLGASFKTLPTHCCCPERTVVCPKATHLFCCNELKPLHLMRHNAIKDDIMELARVAGFRATDSGLSRINDESGRQGDTLFSGLLCRRSLDLVVDYYVANACSPSYVRASSSSTAGFAMKRLETIKYAKYKVMYERAGVDFMPLAMEMHGAISDTF